MNPTKKDIQNIRIRIEKHVNPESIVYSDANNLCKWVVSLLDELSVLKQRLFDMEQSLPSEQQWQDIVYAKLELALLENKKEYLEITNSTNNDILLITIQRKFGKTPEQLMKQSEIRRLKAANKIVNLLKNIKDLERKCSEREQEVYALMAMDMSSPESILETETSLKKAITLLERKVRSFNMIRLRREFTALHPSMRSAFHEAWERAALSDSKSRNLEAQLNGIRLKSSKEKKPVSKLYKKRRAK